MTAMKTSNDGKRSVAPGDFVISECGRDRGGFFIVTGDGGPDYVLIADGKLRKVEKPKKKKLKHVSAAGGRCPGWETLTNRSAAAEIKRFCQPQGSGIINNEKE